MIMKRSVLVALTAAAAVEAFAPASPSRNCGVAGHSSVEIHMSEVADIETQVQTTDPTRAYVPPKMTSEGYSILREKLPESGNPRVVAEPTTPSDAQDVRALDPTRAYQPPKITGKGYSIFEEKLADTAHKVITENAAPSGAAMDPQAADPTRAYQPPKITGKGYSIMEEKLPASSMEYAEMASPEKPLVEDMAARDPFRAYTTRGPTQGFSVLEDTLQWKPHPPPPTDFE